jgi:hypothetical protein
LVQFRASLNELKTATLKSQVLVATSLSIPDPVTDKLIIVGDGGPTGSSLAHPVNSNPRRAGKMNIFLSIE